MSTQISDLQAKVANTLTRFAKSQSIKTTGPSSSQRLFDGRSMSDFEDFSETITLGQVFSYEFGTVVESCKTFCKVFSEEWDKPSYQSIRDKIINDISNSYVQGQSKSDTSTTDINSRNITKSIEFKREYAKALFQSDIPRIRDSFSTAKNHYDQTYFFYPKPTFTVAIAQTLAAYDSDQAPSEQCIFSGLTKEEDELKELIGYMDDVISFDKQTQTQAWTNFNGDYGRLSEWLDILNRRQIFAKGVKSCMAAQKANNSVQK
ncbi:hypothetical protein V866_008029 [Kwoniella sp. B9012]